MGALKCSLWDETCWILHLYQALSERNMLSKFPRQFDTCFNQGISDASEDRSSSEPSLATFPFEIDLRRAYRASGSLRIPSKEELFFLGLTEDLTVVTDVEACALANSTFYTGDLILTQGKAFGDDKSLVLEILFFNILRSIGSFGENSFNRKARCSADKLYEWNIDGLSEQEIINKMAQMSMVGTAYLNNHSYGHSEIVELLVTGFTGTLRGWWDSYFTEESRDSIKSAVKKDDEGFPIFNENQGRGIPDGVNTLIYTILKHFVGTPSNVSS
ncbi:hypothetical protein SO802_011684 [Lithocarpus litseifolius]|uniref:DUF7746 domain-containing protein n=1 Tax=Lithocarpus litseifolius TaxID=425828 RepID=A0AAW2D346_9ROSI